MPIGYTKHYQPGGFANAAGGNTPVTAAVLNDMDNALYELDQHKLDGSGIVANADTLDLSHAADIAKVADGIPVGTLVRKGSSTIPAGFMDCAGADLKESLYAALYAKLGHSQNSYMGARIYGQSGNYNGFWIGGWLARWYWPADRFPLANAAQLAAAPVACHLHWDSGSPPASMPWLVNGTYYAYITDNNSASYRFWSRYGNNPTKLQPQSSGMGCIQFWQTAAAATAWSSTVSMNLESTDGSGEADSNMLKVAPLVDGEATFKLPTIAGWMIKVT